MLMTPPKITENRVLFMAMASGTLKQEKVYKGSDCKTDEMSVDLPAWDSNFAFHPWSLEVILSTKKWKLATLYPP